MKKVNILFIGNSYSDDTVMYLPELFREFKINANVENIVYPGCSIDQHLDFLGNRKTVYTYRFFSKKTFSWQESCNIDGIDLIKSKKWDYISLQQASYLSGLKNSLSNIDDLVEIVKKNCPNEKVKIIWNMTWEYPLFNEFEVFKNEFSSNSRKMYEGIVNNVEKYIIPNKNFAFVIPCGTAIRNAKSIFDDQKLYRDVVHLSFHAGRFITSLTALKTIFNKCIDNVKTKPFSILNDDKVNFIKAVNSACLNPLKETLIKESK